MVDMIDKAHAHAFFGLSFYILKLLKRDRENKKNPRITLKELEGFLKEVMDKNHERLSDYESQIFDSLLGQDAPK